MFILTKIKQIKIEEQHIKFDDLESFEGSFSKSLGIQMLWPIEWIQ